MAKVKRKQRLGSEVGQAMVEFALFGLFTVALSSTAFNGAISPDKQGNASDPNNPNNMVNEADPITIRAGSVLTTIKNDPKDPPKIQCWLEEKDPTDPDPDPSGGCNAGLDSNNLSNTNPAGYNTNSFF